MKYIFEQVSARHIAERNGTKKNDTPPPATAFKICGYKNQQKQIKRYPEVSNAQIRHHTVKKRIG